MLQFKMQLPNLTQPSLVERTSLLSGCSSSWPKGAIYMLTINIYIYISAAIYTLLFESAPTYFIEPRKRVVLPFLCCSPPVVEHCSIFSRWVGKRHPLPRTDFLWPQFCFHCSITLSCITWQQRRCIPVAEKSTGWQEARSSPAQTQRDFRLKSGICHHDV